MSRVLLIGGSGFLSGTLAREALRAGHEVSAVTRGRRPLPPGVRALVADRADAAAFADAVGRPAATWDLVIDCICFGAAHAAQDLACFPATRARHLVFVSTESVIEPAGRPWPIDETYDRFTAAPYGRGKRDAEEVFLAAARATGGRPRLTILRPGHIYGPGSLLGCLPLQWRDAGLLERMRDGRPLSLVGGGHFLQQPVFAADLWPMVESCLDNPRTDGQVYFAPGADTVPCVDYYRFIAQALGVPLPEIQEVSVAEHLRARPEDAAACCHRVCSPDKARAHGLALPATPLRAGIALHVRHFLRELAAGR